MGFTDKMNNLSAMSSSATTSDPTKNKQNKK